MARVRARIHGATRRRLRRGFTLIETALTTVIVGVGVLAMVTAQSAFLQQNVWSTRVSVAERLGNEIRELTVNLPRHDPVNGAATWGPETGEASVLDFDDLDDFDGLGDGTVFSSADENGPIDARRRVIPNMEGWGQVIEVFSVDGSNIAAEPGTVADGTTEFMLIRVTVTFQGPRDEVPQEMTTVEWIAAR
jgi:prepilin-type N-terminal cleavage/methylation domain-containing protein